jgi:hypothetical protein
LFASATVLAALGIWGWHATHHPTSAPTSARLVRATRRSIAILGFRNLSGRPEEGWLSTAIAEMLTTELVAGEKLRLVSGEDRRAHQTRPSARGHRQPLAQHTGAVAQRSNRPCLKSKKHVVLKMF